jgi:hypothetical protein
MCNGWGAGSGLHPPPPGAPDHGPHQQPCAAGPDPPFHEAAQAPGQGAGTSVTCWGTGKPLREFLYVAELGEANVCLRWSVGSQGPKSSSF